MSENKLTVVTNFSTLMKYAYELGEAKKRGNPDEIAIAQSRHDFYRDLCLKSDGMLTSNTVGELS